MADYYPLIARAIAGLDPSAPGESRRALYERARAALIAQLRSVEPPLSESEITRERLSLEEAVRKVESEAAQRARDATRSGDARAPATQRVTAPAPAMCSAPPPAPRRGRPIPRRRRPRRRRVRDRPRRRNSATSGRRSDRKTGRSGKTSVRSATFATGRRRAASPVTGPAAAADARTDGRAAPWPRQQRAAGGAWLPRHRRRRRRSRPRRGAGQPVRAKNLCQRAVALAGIRPARAEHGKPRRRSRRALFV